MLWKGGRQSSNVDDRRGISGGQVAVGGGILGVIALVLNFLIGGDVDTSQLPQIPGIQNSRELSPEEKAADDERGEFVKTVLGYTEDIWNEVYQKSGKDYPEPTLVLFRDAVQSGCGNASAASGPFYCPADQQLYIDLAFYKLPAFIVCRFLFRRKFPAVLYAGDLWELRSIHISPY